MTKNFVVKVTFKKREICIVAYESVPSKIQKDYFLLRTGQRRFVKDLGVLTEGMNDVLLNINH